MDLKKDFGAHGSFDREAHHRSTELWVRTHIPKFQLVSLALAGAAAYGVPRLANGHGKRRGLFR